MTRLEHPEFFPALPDPSPRRFPDFVPGPQVQDITPELPPPLPATAVEGPLAPAGAEPAEQPTKRETDPRLVLRGNVGRSPRMHTSPKGQLIAEFPLGVHGEEEEKTTWHNVVAFGPRAERVRDGLKQGDAVEVIGYLRQRQKRGQDGRARTVQEVWMTAFTPR